MLGMVFSEFHDFVVLAHGEDFADDLIDSCDLPSGGAYTAVGRYDHGEIVQLVGALSAETRTPAPILLQAFGGHLAQRFTELFPDFFSAHDNLHDFLCSVERKIHTEVRKLYAEARPPRVEAQRVDARTLIVDYVSCRQMEALAEGLLRGCARHYGEDLEITSKLLDGGPERTVRFTLIRRG